jgi:PleD family two-component response regulator
VVRASTARASGVPGRHQHGKTIFLVDDSATILLSVSSILGKAGFAVEKAPTPTRR